MHETQPRSGCERHSGGGILMLCSMNHVVGVLDSCVAMSPLVESRETYRTSFLPSWRMTRYPSSTNADHLRNLAALP